VSAPDKASPEVLEEGCYYLSKMGLSLALVAAKFEITEEEAAMYKASYARKLREGKVKVQGLLRQEAQGGEGEGGRL